MTGGTTDEVRAVRDEALCLVYGLVCFGGVLSRLCDGQRSCSMSAYTLFDGLGVQIPVALRQEDLAQVCLRGGCASGAAG